MSISIVIRRLPAFRGKPRPLARLANLITAPTFALAPLLAIVPTATQAADLPVKAPATAAYDWSGCYVGVNGGGGASGSRFTTTVDNGTHLAPADAALVGTDGTGSLNATGFLGGGQAGCNWQSGRLVYGLEGDFDYFHSNPQLINGTNTLSDGMTPFTVSHSLTTDFFASVHPRIGVAADRDLAYITGGAAFTRASYTESYGDGNSVALTGVPMGTGTASASKSLVGWTVGAGWEHAWTDHWTFKIEYLFSSFPTTTALGTIVDAAGGANALHGSADLVVQSARAGVNFKF